MITRIGVPSRVLVLVAASAVAGCTSALGDDYAFVGSHADAGGNAGAGGTIASGGSGGTIAGSGGSTNVQGGAGVGGKAGSGGAAPSCGDGQINGTEACDGADLNGKKCSEVGTPGSTGTLACAADCTFDVGGCVPPLTCGNGVLDNGEQCDGVILAGADCTRALGQEATGMLGCTNDCTYDVTSCRYCGDDKIDQASEACDLTSFPSDADTCAEITGHSDSVGILACLAACTPDVSGCTFCGDGNITGTEACDGANLHGATCQTLFPIGGAGTLKCKSDCSFDESACQYCGDKIVNGAEQCDGSAAGVTCADVVGDGSTGTIACSGTCAYDVSSCTPPVGCHNGVLDPGEACDAMLFPAGTTCASATQHGDATGDVVCSGVCQLDTSGCDYCGDSRLTGVEKCDESDAASLETCALLTGDNASTGNAACKTDCTGFDKTSCAYCGDGIRNNAEACDGTQLGGASCQADRGSSAGGSYVCTSACTIDKSACVYCGDGLVDNGEACDGGVGTATCATVLGAGATGTLACTNCGYDTSHCQAAPTCGNGVVDAGEACDGNASVMVSCATETGATGATGTVTCSPTCKFDTTGCNYCGNDRVDAGEACDGSIPTGTTCPALEQGAPTCTATCTISNAGCSCNQPNTLCPNANGTSACVATLSDASNCGACGHVCGDKQACNAGECNAATILGGVTRQVVDFAVDATTLVAVAGTSTTLTILTDSAKDGTGSIVQTPTTFVSPKRMAMDAANVYVTTGTTAGSALANVVLAPRTGAGAPIALASYKGGVLTGINAVASATGPEAMWNVRLSGDSNGNVDEISRGPTSVTQGVGGMGTIPPPPSTTLMYGASKAPQFGSFFAYSGPAGTYGADVSGADANSFLDAGTATDSSTFTFALIGGTTGGASELFHTQTGLYWLAGVRAFFLATASNMPVAMYTGQVGFPLTGLAADANGVFWSDAAAGQIYEATIKGGGAHVVAPANGLVARIALDDAYVYWLVNAGTASSTIYRAAR